jgi:undecaprenyl-diphosphatase
MTIIQAILLGMVQGLTEFLPISSSAHLVLVPFLFNWKLDEQEAFVFDVLVQLGTLVAVIIYFRKDLLAIIKAFFQGIAHHQPFQDYDSRTAWMIILATIPAGLIGLFFKDQVESAFSNPVLVALMLMVTALLLVLAEHFGKKTRKPEELNFKDALIMGLFQAVAVLPGISRSGSTIPGGLLRQLDRKTAARFSFLMSVPIMAAAGFLAALDLFQLPSLVSFLPVMIIGFIVSAVVGYFAIAWLMRFLTKQPMAYFSIYLFLLSVIVLIVQYVR